MQAFVTSIIVLAALSYATWRVYRLLKGDSDPCQGCELKKNCKKFGRYKEK